jgi:transglutaminase-like putative cysteine protease
MTPDPQRAPPSAPAAAAPAAAPGAVHAAGPPAGPPATTQHAAGTPGAPRPPGRLPARLADLTRDKADTLLLLAAALMVLAPHFSHLPLWTSATVCATLLWRAAITFRGQRMPPLWLLLPISIATMGGVYSNYHTLLGRDAGVAMLALLLAFKLLEMHARRDLFVVIFLSLFLLLTNFFYSQTALSALAMMLTLTLLLTAQLSFQYTGVVPPLARRLRTAAGIVALAAPLALLLFVGFPRIQGPLWGLPGDAHSARSGITDSMAPGAVSALAMSDEVAFRVRFSDPAPPQDQLYWRGIVLGDYDGKTWTRSARLRGPQRVPVSVNAHGKAVRHEVTMEATGKRWLFALELTNPEFELPNRYVSSSDEQELIASSAVTERLRYTASAWTAFEIQAANSAAQMRRWTALPDGYNPRTLALAQTLKQADPVASVRAVLAKFRNENFEYTLEPRLLGRDAVDDFLFGTRSGFCEHYAGAFVVLMRAMQIPARVVTGYQGGELNPVDGYLTVRQSDAHAWAEVWLAGQGWRRIDPTAAVAPERIRSNLAGALPQTGPFGLGPLINLQNHPDSWLAQLRFKLGAMNNAWNQWVLDYNPERQRSFLEELSGAFGNVRTLAAAVLTAVLLWWLRRQRARQPADPLDALYQAFCRQQARHGAARAPDEGPLSYAARLRALPATPEKHAAMAQFLNLYGALKYGGAGPDAKAASLRTLKTLLPLCR